jgi:hypothetical protein
MVDTNTPESVADRVARTVRDGKSSGLFLLPSKTVQQVLDHMQTDVFRARNPDHRYILQKITDEQLIRGEGFAGKFLRQRPAPPPGTDWDKMYREIVRRGRETPAPDDPHDGLSDKKSAFKRGA